MKKIIILALIVIIVTGGFSACGFNEKIEYYSNRDNYIVATGTVDFVNYTNNEEGNLSNRLYIGFSDMSVDFEDDCFVIAGRNMDIVLANGIETKLKIGDKITFVAAPKVFGDGYVIPIVSITIAEEELLKFDDGYMNLLDYLKKGQP